MTHIATLALLGKLPRGACHACPRNFDPCRRSEPLNGREAAQEFARRLRGPAKRAVGL